MQNSLTQVFFPREPFVIPRKHVTVLRRRWFPDWTDAEFCQRLPSDMHDWRPGTSNPYLREFLTRGKTKEQTVNTSHADELERVRQLYEKPRLRKSFTGKLSEDHEWLAVDKVNALLQPFATFWNMGHPQSRLVVAISRRADECPQWVMNNHVRYGFAVLNLRGRHWVGVFYDRTVPHRVEHFDSLVATANEPLVVQFVQTQLPQVTEIRCNRTVHQKGNAKCGLYVLVFLYRRLLRHYPMERALNERITDGQLKRFVQLFT